MRPNVIVLFASLVLAHAAMAQPTAFTYQGHLKNGAQPAAGPHDFRFRLFNTDSGGTPIGVTQCADNVPVAAGLFTTTIDFGQQFDSTAARFLEIEVRADTGLDCASTDGFVLLTSRQPLTAAPRASHANSAFSLAAADGNPAQAVAVDASGNVGIGTMAPTAKLDVRGGPVLVENLGDQADLLWLATERSWVFRQEGTGAVTALKLESVGGGGNKNFIVQTAGFMGVGTVSPQAKLDVRGDIRMGNAGQHLATAGDENLRVLRGAIQTTGTPFSGSGWSSSRLGVGRYSVDYDTSFPDVPVVVAMAATSSPRSVTVINDNGGGFILVVLDGNGVPVDTSVRFIVAGGR